MNHGKDGIGFFDVGEGAAAFEHLQPDLRCVFNELALQCRVERPIVASGEHHDRHGDFLQPGSEIRDLCDLAADDEIYVAADEQRVQLYVTCARFVGQQ